MHSLGDMAKSLNRFPVQLSTLQKQFALPSMVDAGYSDAYLTFLRTVISLRTLNISDDVILNLWHLEKKLLQLLHADSTGSPTWFLDECGRTTHANRRLLLTNYDIGMALDSQGIQPGLNFDQKPRELFAGTEMGEDALRVLREILKLRERIHSAIAAELPHLRTAVKWAASLATRK
ncbi:MAG: hypothetical protein RLZZ221_2951 [Verrucomicrobiota bacterium]